MFDRHQTVANVVLEHAECAPVFQRHQIDFCRRSTPTLDESATAKGVDIETLLLELSNAVKEKGNSRSSDPRTLSTPRLIAYIITRHHESLRKTVPFLRSLSEKVRHMHGAYAPGLTEIAATLVHLDSMLLPHLDFEENSLFPALVAKRIDRTEVARELDAVTEYHSQVVDMLARIRTSSDDFALPDWACVNYRSLFSMLKQLEADLFLLLHLENHLLFPRFAPVLEERIAEGGQA